MKVALVCPNCSETFYVKPVQAARRKYCSKACMASGYSRLMSGSGNLNYQNSARINARPIDLPACTKCGTRVPARRRKMCDRCFEENKQRSLVPVTCVYCMKEFRTYECYARRYCSRRCTDLHKRILQAGPNSVNWQGGKTSETRRVRASSEYKEWRDAVFSRDNYTCVECGRRRRPGDRVELHADHIESFSERPDLRLEVSNGRTLCVECHKDTLSYGFDPHVGRQWFRLEAGRPATLIDICSGKRSQKRLSRIEGVRASGAIVIVADSIDSFIRQWKEIFEPSSIPN